MQTTARLLQLLLLASFAIQTSFAKPEKKIEVPSLKNTILKSSIFPVFELGYINQKVDSDSRADKTGYSSALGLGLRYQAQNNNIFSTALLLDYHSLSGSVNSFDEEVSSFGSILYLGFHRRFKTKKHTFEDGLNLRTRIGPGIAYTYRGRNNIEVVTSIGPEIKYVTTLNEKEVRLSLGGYYDLGVTGQSVWSVLFKMEGYYDFMNLFNKVGSTANGKRN